MVTKNPSKPVRDSEELLVCLEYLETKLTLDTFQNKYGDVIGGGIQTLNAKPKDPNAGATNKQEFAAEF